MSDRIKEMLEKQMELLFEHSEKALCAEDLHLLTESMCMLAEAIHLRT